MGNCIYLINSKEDLTYRGEEHIIPAGLGGMQKLPKGTVSDEVNHLFSKREIIALRDTILAINRYNNGPGKRGSSCVREVKKPVIDIFEVDSEQNFSDNQLDAIYAPVRLGFLFYGEIQMIPQIIFPIRADYSFQWPRIIMGTTSKQEIKTTEYFTNELKDFLEKTYKEHQKDYKIVHSEIKRIDRYFILGCHNHTWYVNTSFSDSHIASFFKMMEKVPLPEPIPVFPTTKANYRYNKTLPKIFDESFEFIYVKTAFNVLTFLSGIDFIKDKQFDEIRDAIVCGRNLFDNTISRVMPEWLVKWVINEVKPKSHFIVIHGHDNLIEAYVSFYREPLNVSICLSKDFSGEEFKKFFICNYIERTEKYGSIL